MAEGEDEQHNTEHNNHNQHNNTHNPKHNKAMDNPGNQAPVLADHKAVGSVPERLVNGI